MLSILISISKFTNRRCSPAVDSGENKAYSQRVLHPNVKWWAMEAFVRTQFYCISSDDAIRMNASTPHSKIIFGQELLSSAV